MRVVPLVRWKSSHHKEGEADQDVGSQYVPVSFRCQKYHQDWFIALNMQLYFVAVQSSETNPTHSQISTARGFIKLNRRVGFPLGIWNNYLIWGIWCIHIWYCEDIESEWYRGKDIWALFSISRYIKTSYHLEKDGYAEVHKWLCEINDIFSRIIDCHCSHCDITRVLHQLLKYNWIVFRWSRQWLAKNRWEYPNKSVPLVSGEVERPVVVVVDQLHLVVEAHLAFRWSRIIIRIHPICLSI